MHKFAYTYAKYWFRIRLFNNGIPIGAYGYNVNSSLKLNNYVRFTNIYAYDNFTFNCFSNYHRKLH